MSSLRASFNGYSGAPRMANPTASLARELAHDFEREPALLVVTGNFDDGLIEAAGDIFVEPRTAILGRAGHCEGVCGLDGKQAHGRVEIVARMAGDDGRMIDVEPGRF